MDGRVAQDRRTAMKRLSIAGLRTWLHRHRSILIEYGIVFAIYSVVTVVLTNFVLLNISHQVFSGGSGDATAGFLWLNYADHSLSPLLTHTDKVNYPYGEDLGGPTFVTYLVLWLPLRLLSYIFGPVAGLNLMMYLGFMLAAMSGYWFVKRLTHSRAVAFFGGYAIAFVPYNIYKSASHLAYLYCFVFVLLFAAFYNFWRRPSRMSAVMLAASYALAIYTDGYYLLIASVTMAIFVLTGLFVTYFQKSERRLLKQRTKAFILSAILMVIALLPIAFVQFSQGAKVKEILMSSRPSDPASEMRAYRARIADFLLPSRAHPVFSQDNGFEAVAAYEELRSTPSERMNYIGYTILAPLVAGAVIVGSYLVRKKRSSLARAPAEMRGAILFFGALVVIATPIYLSFMFSPAGEIKGHTILLPGQIMADLGIGFWRVLARFFIPMHVLYVICACLVIAFVIRSIGTSRRRRTMALVALASLTLLMVFEYLTLYNRPSFSLDNLPRGYSWLSSQKDINTIAELPMVDALDGKTGFYATAQLVHGKKLVNMKEPSKGRLNNAIGTITNPESINIAYERGAQAIVTHDVACMQQVAWGRLVYDETKDNPNEQLCIYRLLRPVATDDYFVRFGKGFDYTAVREKPYESFIKLGSEQATFDITDDSLVKSAKGQVAVRTTLRPISNDPLTIKWEFVQDGRLLSSGQSSERNVPLSFKADAALPVQVRVEYVNTSLTVKDVDTYFVSTVVE